MSSREPGRLAILGPGAVLVALLFAGLLLIDFFLESPSRPVATRLVTTGVLVLAALRVRTLVRVGLAREMRSAFDAAPASAPGVDRSRFHQLHDEVRFSAKHRRYFELVFWPRLVGLARARAGDSAPWLEKPPGRSFGRGPSPEALARLVAAIEAHR